MARMLVGYARCSTDAQDLTAQRDALTALGVKPNRVYVDHGLTGTNRSRPGLCEALAASRSGDTLVVTKLDRLARSLTDARNIVEELTEAGVKLKIGGSLHNPNDPVGRLLSNVLGLGPRDPGPRVTPLSPGASTVVECRANHGRAGAAPRSADS
jgi:DNA invertase Pin-like site-specific DNA recombinase